MTKELIIHDLSRRAYDPTLELQLELLERVIADPARPAHLLLVEHDPPVITLGKSARPANVLAGPEALARAGVELRPAARGGDVTWHGPGQLVAYPIVPLAGRGVRQYVHDLEEAVIRLAGRYGISAGRVEGATGVWVGGHPHPSSPFKGEGSGAAKLAAIGVAVKRWTAYHGLAINIAADLPGFDLIIPCGLHKPVTSFERLLGRAVDMREAKTRLVEELSAVLGFGCHGQPEGWPCSKGTAEAAVPQRRRFPPWLVMKRPPVEQAGQVRRLLDDLGLATVCSSARCPNRAECFSRGTATFLILGEVCSRRCRFCAVTKGTPAGPREDEPQAVASAAAEMKLRHVVITSVTRDDLSDGGAVHFARTIQAVRERLPHAVIEVLTPDFNGRPADIETALAARPDVFNHNIETVPRLYPTARPQADYRRSLDVLAHARRWADGQGAKLHTKSGLMVGLGETPAEIADVMADLRQAGCDILTIGQYLQPTPESLPVAEFIAPDQFDAYRRQGLALGFSAVAAGPLVRSSYQADAVLDQARG